MINTQKISFLMANKVSFNLACEAILKCYERIIAIKTKIFRNKSLKFKEKEISSNRLNLELGINNFDFNFNQKLINDISYNEKDKNQNVLDEEMSFINIITKDGISKEAILTKEEVLVLKLAVNHNGNIVNLCNKSNSIKSLFLKGLVCLSDNGAFVVVNKAVEMLIKTEKAEGCFVVGDDLSRELKNNYEKIYWKNL